MSTVNVERVRAAISTGKTLGTTSMTGRNGILCRYFYFAMSLLLAAMVVDGFKRTVDENCFIPRYRGFLFSGFVLRLSLRG
jgi:hypothetical protein